MNTFLRCSLVAALIGGAWYGQSRLTAHLHTAMLPAAHQIAPQSATIPKSLGAWRGEDETLGASQPTDAGSLKRNYFHASTGQVATLYVTYSPAGQGAVGNAEVAGVVRGTGVDPAVPSTFEIAPDLVASQVRLPAGGSGRWLFRWSYALPRRHEASFDRIQTAYRRLHVGSPQVTIEVFVPENFPTDPEAARDFARLVDTAIRPILGPDASRADHKRELFAFLFK